MRINGVVMAGAAAAGALFAGSASGAITGVSAIQVPNHVWFPTGQSPATDVIAGAAWAARPWATFDIVLNGNAGDLVLGITHALIAPGGATQYFNHSAGSDLRSFPLEPIFPAIGFDTYVTLGGNDHTNGAPITLLTADLSGTAGGTLSFSFSTNAPTPVGANGQLRVMRISMVDFDPGGGLFFVPINIGVLTPTGWVQFNWIPSPGGGVAFFLASGLVGARRRRG